MQIVIDIPEEIYNIVTEEGTIYGGGFTWLMNSVANGVVLPEHYGDLVDKGDILHDLDCDEEMRLGKNVEWVREVIRNAPTIIKSSEEGAAG